MTTKITIKDVSSIHPRYHLPDLSFEVVTPVAGEVKSRDKGVHTKAVKKAVEQQMARLTADYSPSKRGGFKIGGPGDAWKVVRTGD